MKIMIKDRCCCRGFLYDCCFLCVCAANDAGHEATGGPPQELAAKRLVIDIIRPFRNVYYSENDIKSLCNSSKNKTSISNLL